jgi:hypothetical protein
MASRGKKNETTFRIPVVALLRSNWQFDADRQVFTSGKRRVFSPWTSLPADSQIVSMVPRLAQVPKSRLTAAERRLARYVHIVLPYTVSPEQILGVVQAWPSVSEAHVGPRPALPGTATPSPSASAAAPTPTGPAPVVLSISIPNRRK